MNIFNFLHVFNYNTYLQLFISAHSEKYISDIGRPLKNSDYALRARAEQHCDSANQRRDEDEEVQLVRVEERCDFASEDTEHRHMLAHPRSVRPQAHSDRADAAAV